MKTKIIILLTGLLLLVPLTSNINKVYAAKNKIQCVTNSGQDGVNTALGCIPTNLEGDGFIKSILTLGIGIGGAIALILIVYGLFLITTSGGIPDKVNAGKEVITSAIAGLIFIIFSTILMNIIGINILGLPGLQ